MEEIMLFTGKFNQRMTQLALAVIGVSSLAGAQAQTVISEVLYDAAGTDNGNVFVELFGTPGTLLDGLCWKGLTVRMAVSIGACYLQARSRLTGSLLSVMTVAMAPASSVVLI
jgi:hypothetical protein